MSFQYEVNERFYTLVAANTQEDSDYIISNGKTIELVNMGISSSAVPDTAAFISFDPDGTIEYLISSYGEIVHKQVQITLTGDGVKVIRMSLVNDLSEPTYMGAFFQGVFL